MKIYYKISCLSDGTKVKITSELFNQIKVWELENISVSDYFKDTLKVQDDKWINSYRQYYRSSIPLNNLKYDGQLPNIISATNIKKDTINGNIIEAIYSLLDPCTLLQKKHFIKHYFEGFSISEITIREKRNRTVIYKSIRKARNFVIAHLH